MKEEFYYESFESVNREAIDEDSRRMTKMRTRLLKPLGFDSLTDENGYTNSGGVTIESHGVGNLRVNMGFDVMEGILDYYDTEVERAYRLLDER